jgi:signal transduction histidine kinase
MYTRLAERERIARDLHDTFFQGVQGLFLTINSATRQMPKDDPFRPIFEDALAKSDNVMSEGRDLVLNLRSHLTSNQDLATLLNEWGKEITAASTVSFRVTVTGEARPLQAAAMDELYWLGREALTNAFRHSGAEAIEVDVGYDKAEVTLRIRDNGSGIDSETLKQGRRENHFGLQGMNERARKIGAQLRIWSSPNAGTEIDIRITAILAYETSKTNFRARVARFFSPQLSDRV